MGVSSDELTSIAALHVMNCIMLLNRRLVAEDQSIQRALTEIDAKCQEDISRIKYEVEVAKQGALRQSISKQPSSKRWICTRVWTRMLRRMCL